MITTPELFCSNEHHPKSTAYCFEHSDKYQSSTDCILTLGIGILFEIRALTFGFVLLISFLGGRVGIMFFLAEELQEYYNNKSAIGDQKELDFTAYYAGSKKKNSHQRLPYGGMLPVQWETL